MPHHDFCHDGHALQMEHLALFSSRTSQSPFNDGCEPMRMIVYFVISFILFLNNTLSALSWEWKTLASAKGMRKIVATDTALWCATDGGALRYDFSSNRFQQFLNTDGLAGNDVVAIDRDSRGRIWVAIADGTLNIYDPMRGVWSTIKDYVGQTINDLYAYGDSIFVSLSIGVSLYNARRWEVKETYKIGETNRVQIFNGEIWAAGKTALRRAKIDFPNLMAPTAWTVYTTAAGMQDNFVSTVCLYDGMFFIATRTGISIYDGVAWQSTEMSGFEIRDLAIWQGQLIALSYDGIYVRKAADLWEKVGGGVWTGVTLAVDTQERIWVGLQKDGLMYYDPSQRIWHEVIPEGPADNRFTALTFDHNGNLWTASSSGGVSRFDGNHWLHFNVTNKKTQTNLFMDLTVDKKNRVWAASWGGGVYIFTTTGDSIRIDRIHAANGLKGIDIDPNYVVVTKVMADDRGNIWILNYEAANLQVVAVVDSLFNWQYFSTLDGIKSRLVTTLAMDLSNRKWIGTQDMGVRVLDDNGTPFDKRDDDLSQGLTLEDGLSSLHIRTLACDRDGLMWIGTPEGLFYWYDGQVKPRYSLINDNINIVAVDVRNNKWIGTTGGLTLLEADGFTMRHFSTSNSPLVNDYITCFAFDENSGKAYIGTTNGISCVQTPYTRPAQNLSMLRGYPNPFILQRDSYFHIENLVEQVTVYIYTAEGKLVRRIPSSQIFGSRVDWDGRNDAGEWVVGGIYLFLAVGENGMSNVGKVAVIRP